MPLADPNGTEKVVAVSEPQVLTAISNAFRLFRYHDMMLPDAVGSDYMAVNWSPTNGSVLLPTLSALGTVSTRGIIGTRRLEYLATFHITTAPVSTNATRVNVRTVAAKVLDGITLGHGGTVANTVNVRPIRLEEDNVLRVIELELNSEKTRSDKAK